MRVLDLFCGAGGFSEGMRQAGHDIICAVDNNKKALITHEENHYETTHLTLTLGDDPIDEIIELGPYDVVTGSPPCQPFSVANQFRDPGEGMKLINEHIKIVGQLRPQYWIGENVVPSQSFLHSNHPTIYKTILSALDFGVPQTRRRLFFGDFVFPKATHNRYPFTDFFGEFVPGYTLVNDIIDEDADDWKEYDDMPEVARRRLIDAESYKAGKSFATHKPIFIYSSNSMRTITAHKDNRYLVMVRYSNSSMNGETTVTDLYNPSWTLTTQLDFLVANPRDFKFRYITELEIKRIMGFPDDYRFIGGKTERLKQMGNAVCPPVAKALGEALR